MQATADKVRLVFRPPKLVRAKAGYYGQSPLLKAVQAAEISWLQKFVIPIFSFVDTIFLYYLHSQFA
jgi:hypothetical protein